MVVSIHRAGGGEGASRGRENCTLRRFNIRGLIEGMFRTVMGSICWGSHKAQVPSMGERKQGRNRKKEGGGWGVE